MKTIQLIAVVIFILSVNACSQNGKTKDMDSKKTENSYPTAEAAMTAVKENLHLLLNDAQRRSYDLSSDDQIKSLTVTNDLPLIMISLEQLSDTIINSVAEARLFALGQGGNPRICISVQKSDNNWMTSSVGMKRYVNAIDEKRNLTGIVQALGLELEFLELSSNNVRTYTPIRDYPEAELFATTEYTAAELLRSLNNYRTELERKFGKDFISGELDR